MIEPVPFVPSQQSGHEKLAGAGPVSFNIAADAVGAIRRRPGIRAHSPVTSSVVDTAGLDAIHVSHDGRMYAVGALGAGRPIYRVGAGGSWEFGGGSGRLAGNAARPTIAETEALIVLAAGADIQKIDIAAQSSDRLGGSPPKATHVAAQGGRLICNDVATPGAVNYSCVATGSAVTGHETWNGATDGFSNSGSVSATGRPDPVRAIHENTNEVFAFGGTTMQLYGSDESLRYVPLATREYGCIAPYSVVKDDDSFAWLDDRRRFIKSNGREYDDQFGLAIQQTLDDMATVDDCFGYRVHLGPVDALCWTFPTDGRTFVYQKRVGWSQWAGWNDTTNGWSRFIVNCAHQRPDTGVNVVGTTGGYVGELHATTYADLGTRIVARVDTGFLNRGTDKRKFCRALYLSLKRGEVSGATSPVAFVSWRDDGGAWRQAVPVELGISGDREIVYPLRSLGIYRRRQWRFEFSGAEELVLAGAQEDFEVLAD